MVLVKEINDLLEAKERRLVAQRSGSRASEFDNVPENGVTGEG